MSLFLSPCARWHNRTATWAKFRTGSEVTIISSPAPIERLLEPVDVKEGYFEVNEDVNCLMNVRAARMFPFWRFLEIRGLNECD